MNTMKFRPEAHFSAARGWINDPNGLVYARGKYHLFAQYAPDTVSWGPMHWCHAVSTDLIHWAHLPDALAPDNLGMIFSGSAVYDENNTSGFGTTENPPVVAMYTSHGRHEQQSIAWSADFSTFIKYPGNPVLKNSTIRDFRDPKIFKLCGGRWGMVVSAGDRVFFYESQNLRDWAKTGEFGPEGNLSEGVWECPDLFPADIHGNRIWVLIVSMGNNWKNHGSRVQYFLGDFHNGRFVCTHPFGNVEFLDCGFDNYAAATFNNTKERILIGWESNLAYADKSPTEAENFRGIHTFPRILTLASTQTGGLRIVQTPVTANVFRAAPEKCTGSIPGPLFRLDVTGEGASEISLLNKAGESFKFGVNERNDIFTDRTCSGRNDFDANFASEWFSKACAPRLYNGRWEMSLFADHMSTELFADGGSRVFTQLVFPSLPYDRVCIKGDAAAVIRRGAL